MLVSYTLTEEAEALVNSVDGADVSFDKAHPDDAGFDLRAVETSYLYPDDSVLVKTGLIVAIPKGFFGMIVPRSGMVKNLGITVANSPGIVDSGYRGEVCVLLHRFQDGIGNIHWIRPGDRIAQMIIMEHRGVGHYVSRASFEQTYMNTERGSGGFGSTGR